MGFSFVPCFGNLTHFFASSRLMHGFAKRTVRQLAIEKYSSPFVNQSIVSCRPEKRTEQCNPCSKCQMMRLRRCRLTPSRVRIHRLPPLLLALPLNCAPAPVALVCPDV